MATTSTSKNQPRSQQIAHQAPDEQLPNRSGVDNGVSGNELPATNDMTSARVPSRSPGPRGGIGNEVRQLVRDKANAQFDSQKDRAAGALGAVAGAVRSATQGLEDTGQQTLAGYVVRAADEMDRWRSNLGEHNLDQAMREVQDFARRKPTVFLGVAFSVGLVAARFFKSSAPTTSRSRPMPQTPSASRPDGRMSAQDSSNVGNQPTTQEAY